MGFKSAGQRKFMFALDKDQTQGKNFTSNPSPVGNAAPMVNTSKAKLNNFASPQIKSSVIGQEPKLPKAPRFAKVKKFLK